jgi:hypothetical protein
MKEIVTELILPVLIIMCFVFGLAFCQYLCGVCP